LDLDHSKGDRISKSQEDIRNPLKVRLSYASARSEATYVESYVVGIALGRPKFYCLLTKEAHGRNVGR
jgi:hypothetical protein